jgi:hypothetical protein
VRPTLYLAVLAYTLSARAVFGGELIKPTIEFNDLRVVVTYVSTNELLTLQGRYSADLREIRQDYRHGFSILKRNRETDALTCEIYLPNDKRPRKVDDEATLSLGHELLHCMIGDYHR